MIIAIDAMGGDFAPKAQVKAAVDAVNEFKQTKVILIGDKDKIRRELDSLAYKDKTVSIIHTSENIENEEKPVKAVKSKKDSPTVVGLELVKSKKADAFITSGSTGALLAGSLMINGRIPGIKRPALTVVYPTLKGGCVLLDLGANASCKSEYINQFGFMGSEYAKAMLKIQNPKVGLINIGSEEEKGSQVYIDAHQLLKQNEYINFAGNVEARDIPKGNTDVLVCDGFTGNIVLKLTEGVAMNMMKLIKEGLMSSIKSKIGALLSKPALMSVKKKLDYEEYGGAILLGVNDIVIKAHGSSNAKAFKNAIRQSIIINEAGLVDKIKDFAKKAREEEILKKNQEEK